ncbi:hypothetical protein [Microbacterium sp.]|uniref:hypothetical protein n=1 Tax=Microbacterium sp. TaxID=51671 RepID=UPI00281151C2|nr:hypothetical protein [Microbacterium sp.]
MPDDTEDRPEPLDRSGLSAWEDEAVSDPFSGSVFSQEIAGIDESDWDIDSALIWGDESSDTDDSGMPPGGDFIV